MQRYKWNNLNNQQVGAYTEYFVKMELTMFGFQVYTTEVDDRGIDFIARYNNSPFIEVQVKSLRSMGYVFMQKDKLILHPHRYIAFGLLLDGSPPMLYLIPSTVWKEPNSIFVSREYKKPEWGINVSNKNIKMMEPYRFETSLKDIIQNNFCEVGAWLN